MKRIAAPMVGGVVTSVIMELLVYPVIYEFLKQKGLDRSEARTVNNEPNKEA
jgi:Cu(I)/Ag(I) efflux system membrane protein CusA/SilA